MTQPDQKDVVRCTLQSFVGKSIKSFEMNERQELAIQRLSQLKCEKFEELCKDIINEIHRRSGMQYDQGNRMNDKFMRLSDIKFKNLVVDTLSVFYLKNPEFKMEEFPEFLDNLKSLIEQLKIDSEKNSFLKKMEKLDFYEKLLEFLDYSKNMGAEENLVKHIQESIDGKIADDSTNFCESLCFPKIFIEKLSLVVKDDHKIKNFTESEFTEFEDHRKRIEQTLDDKELKYQERSKLIKEDLLHLIKMVIDKSNIPFQTIENIDSEIQSMIDILESMKDDIETDNKTDFERISEKLMEVVDSIINKLESKSKKEKLYEIQLQKMSLETLGEMESYSDSFQMVIDVIKNIRKTLGEIE